MKYVLDASVAVRIALPTSETPKAQQLLDDYAHQVHELMALLIYPAEVASALTKGERTKTIQFGEARKFLLDLLQNLPVLHDFTPLLCARRTSPRTAEPGFSIVFMSPLPKERGANSLQRTTSSS